MEIDKSNDTLFKAPINRDVEELSGHGQTLYQIHGVILLSGSSEGYKREGNILENNKLDSTTR